MKLYSSYFFKQNLLTILSEMTTIRIDNCIVRESGSMISVESVHLFRKRNPSVKVEYLPYVFTGSRRKDAILIHRILSGREIIANKNIIFPDEILLK